MWKNAITAPIPKVSIPRSVNDFRPIDLASISFNCMQKLIVPQITQAIDQYGDSNQFAYRKGLSCTDAVLSLIHNIVTGLNNKDTTISKVLFLDFSSAFNTVLPNRLIQDMQGFVEEPWLLHWVSNFVNGSSRQIKYSKGLTEKSEINVGVPQGGPLSSLLFTVYTDEIRSTSKCTVVTYADDTAIVCNVSKQTHQADQASYKPDTVNIVDLCDGKNLRLNPKKSKEMVFENINIKHEGLVSCKLTKISIKDAELERTHHTVYLGVCIDDKLSFTGHLSRILKRVYFIVSTLSYIVPYFNVDVRKRVFTVNILPHLLYAVSAWYRFLLIKDKKRIITILKFCSTIFNIDFNSLMSTVNSAAKNEFFRSVNCVQTNDRHSLHTELNSLIRETTRYNLRSKAITQKFRINVYKNSFIYRAALYVQNGNLDNLL